MAQQLTIFGTLEPVATACEPPPPPLPVTSLLEQWPVDPRQASLFEGPHRHRLAAEAACERLDAGAVLAEREEALRLYPDFARTVPFRRWAEVIERLVGPSADRLPPREQAARALALPATDASGLPAATAGRVRAAALADAAERLVAAEGPDARLDEGGRPVGHLLLSAGRHDAALRVLAAASAAREQAGLPPEGRLLGYEAEALARLGRKHEALARYRDAFLEDPAGIDESELTLRAVGDLLDLGAELELADPRAFVPVLAELKGQLPLPALALREGASVAYQVAVLLAGLRRLAPAARRAAPGLEAKREMIRLAPGLRELLRQA